VSATVSWLLALLGPFAFVLIPQWLGRKALAKKGLPHSLRAAKAHVLHLLLSTHVTVTRQAHGATRIALEEIVGDSVPQPSRGQNQLRIEAYQRFVDTKLTLPLIYNLYPAITLGVIQAIVNIVGLHGSKPGPADAKVQIVHGTGTIVAMVVCIVSCAAITCAYLKIRDILAPAESGGLK